MDGDDLWRWIVRGSGLGGGAYCLVFYPEVPQHWLILFAGMIGLPEFIKSRKERREDRERE